MSAQLRLVDAPRPLERPRQAEGDGGGDFEHGPARDQVTMMRGPNGSAIAEVLGRYRYTYSSERDLHQGIASVLDTNGIGVTHEVRRGTSHRLDFLVTGGWAIEVKVDGSLAAALAQVIRYLTDIPELQGVLIATTKHWVLPAEVKASYPVELVVLRRAAF